MRVISISKRQTSGGIFLLIMFFTVLLAVFITYPKYNDWREKQQEISDASTQLNKIKTDSDTATQNITNINAPDFDNVDLAIPSNPSLGDLYAQIEKLAKQSNVLLSSVQALADASSIVSTPDASTDTSNLITVSSLPDGLGSVSISIDINGTPDAVQQFLNSLYGSLRIIDVQSLAITSTKQASNTAGVAASANNGPTIINTKIQAQTYYSKPL